MKTIKVALSVTLDSDLVETLKKMPNTSTTINEILKNALTTERGLDQQIEQHEEYIKGLKETRERIKVKKEELMNTLPKGVYEQMDNITQIIENDPDKSRIWTTILNRDYELGITPEELKELTKRWKDGRRK